MYFFQGFREHWTASAMHGITTSLVLFPTTHQCNFGCCLMLALDMKLLMKFFLQMLESQTVNIHSEHTDSENGSELSNTQTHLLTSDLLELSTVVNPLEESGAFGVDLYASTLEHILVYLIANLYRVKVSLSKQYELRVRK